MDESTGVSEVLLYRTEDDRTRIEVRLEGGTVWLTQAQLATLFETTPQNITQHLKAIYEDGEQAEEATCKGYLQVRKEGAREVQRTLRHYSLEVVLAMGYRVRSPRGTQFRQWATERLREYLVKGFVLDDQRLKDVAGWDYFDELLARVREIRASEKRFYQKVKDLYATSMDYDGKSETAQLFFKKVQNKMLWAVTGHTAAELIAERSNSLVPNMGLQSWKGSRVRKGDVAVAKNYLSQPEIEELDRIVVMYLDYAEDQAKRRRAIAMAEWEQKLDAFLSFNERELLTHAGTVQAKLAEALVLARYTEFDERRRLADRAEADTQDDVAIEEIRRRLPVPDDQSGGADR